MRGNCLCVMNVKRSVSFNGYPMSFLTLNTSRRFLDIQRVASCSILDTDVMIWTCQRSFLHFQISVFCSVDQLSIKKRSSGICNCAYDLCKSSSMTLFNFLYLTSILRLIHYNDENINHFSYHQVTIQIFHHHSLNDISSLFFSWYRRIIISHEE